MLAFNDTLKFNKEYYNIVKLGVKTSTIRKHCHVKEGEIIRAIFETKSIVLFLKITKITPIALRGLTDEIAKKEGYLGVDLLKATLERIYDVSDDSELFYQIEFEQVEPKINSPPGEAILRGDFD